MSRRIRAVAALAASVSSLLALAGCGDEPPSIAAVEWRLEARPSEAGARYESLSAFASIKGGAAEAGIEELWIVNDGEELAWKLTADDWIKKDEGAEAWIGGAPFAMSDFSPIPRGQYRVVAIDPSGQRAERTFTVFGEFPPRASPSVSTEGGVAASSTWPETLILAFDGAGELIAQAAVPAKRSSVAELFGSSLAPRTVRIAAYGYDPELRMGAFSARVEVK